MMDDLNDQEIDKIFAEHFLRTGGKVPVEYASVDCGVRLKTDVLKDIYRKLVHQNHRFQSGDIVTWKPSLRNRGAPEYGEPAIVIDAFDVPMEHTVMHHDHFFTIDRADLLLGVFDDDGDLFLVCGDSRRYQLMDEEK